MKQILEYIWIGGNNEIRSKTKVVDNIEAIPEWSYDASSTNQSSDFGNTEMYLKPAFVCTNPLNETKYESFLVLCETHDICGNPTNTRSKALETFNKNRNEEPWFGLEQEYFFSTTPNHIFFKDQETQGRFYCGNGLNNIQRKIANEHLEACLNANIDICGLNSEVAPNQWEFQIGPSTGIIAADHMIVARFLLERIAEKHGLFICYDPKPFSIYNGSGCHTNFSTKTMRESGGIDEIMNCMSKLEKTHKEDLRVYGENNEKRLTGKHETSSMNVFSYGVGTRNTSIRIPVQVHRDGCGYFEDRRPASNMDPYVVTSTIFKNCCL